MVSAVHNYNSTFTPKERFRIWKNVAVIGVAFMIHFTAFAGAANLQSSINAAKGLGTASLAAIYISFVLSNIFLPALIIRWLGCKWTMAVSILFYMPYIAVQMIPSFYSLIPAGVLVGIGAGPLWCAKCTYITAVAEVCSTLLNVPAETLVVRFFGFFYMLFHLSQVWGNLISSLILSAGNDSTELNSTIVSEVCGGSFLASSDSETALQEEPEYKIQLMSGIYLACMLVAFIIIAFGVDPLKRYQSKKKETEKLSGLQLLAVTTNLLQEPYQMLVLLFTFSLGLVQAFIGVGYTSAFVSCSLGTNYVGYVMMAYGIMNSISAVSSGLIAKKTGRLPITIMAAMIDIALFVTITLWSPRKEDLAVFFVIAALWGFCDGIWSVQINSFCGILFPGREEAAYSNFRLWESFGYILAYMYSSYLRVNVQVYILMVTFFVGFSLYSTAEHKWRVENLRDDDSMTSKRRQPSIEGFDNPAFSFSARSQSGNISIGKIE